MSRVGKQIIALPPSVTVMQEGRVLTAKGPKGELMVMVPSAVTIQKCDEGLSVLVANPNEKRERALWGTWASHLKNMVKGVSEGFSKALEINGVGYKAGVSGKQLTLNVGFSHPVLYTAPEGITIAVDKNIITVSGSNKELVGRVASEIKKIRPVEPYKGKGIMYVGEVVRRKAGKAAKGEVKG